MVSSNGHLILPAKGTVTAPRHCHALLEERQNFYETRLAALVRAPERSYRKQIEKEFKTIVPENRRVLEMGCAFGDLLSALKPSVGVGVDFSPMVIQVARQLHPGLQFHLCEAADFRTSAAFDYIVLSDLVNDLPDVQRVFENLRDVAHARTRLVVNFVNHLWYPVLRFAELLGLKKRRPQQNWLSTKDVRNLLHLAGWEVIRCDTRILWPLRIPFLSDFCNRFLGPLLRPFCLSDFVIARPLPRRDCEGQYSCTVVIPVRNERGNLEAVLTRLPEMGLGTEVVFVEGDSTDGSWDEIQRVMQVHPDRKIRAFKQSGRGKGEAVREAFSTATGDILLILDADLTVAPEDLPKFYELARSGVADFVNGVRLVYPVERDSMRFLNMLANKSFGAAFSWLLGQPIKDTLCGTKVLFREDYEAIARNRSYFGDFDPFGDFDLLFGAAKLNLRIVDLPIRYQARTYGETNIRRWQHGWLLLKMLVFGALRLKFV